MGCMDVWDIWMYGIYGCTGYMEGCMEVWIYGLMDVWMSYFKIGDKIAVWLSKVPECKINCSSKMIADKLEDIKLTEDEEHISFDVVSLYTNVSVNEAIEVFANLLYNGINEAPPIDKDTFITPAKMSSCNVLMSNT